MTDSNVETNTADHERGRTTHHLREQRSWNENDTRLFTCPDTGQTLIAVELQDGSEAVMERDSFEALQVAGYRGRLFVETGYVKVWRNGRDHSVARIIAKQVRQRLGRSIGDGRQVQFKDGNPLNLRLSNLTALPGPTRPAETIRHEGGLTRVWLQDGSWATFDRSVWKEWCELGLPSPHVDRRPNGTEMVKVSAYGEAGKLNAAASRLVLAIMGDAPGEGVGVFPVDGDVRNLRAENLGLTASRTARGREAAIIADLRFNKVMLDHARQKAAPAVKVEGESVALAWAFTSARLMKPSTPRQIARLTGIKEKLANEMAKACDAMEALGFTYVAFPTWSEASRLLQLPRPPEGLTRQ